MLLLRKYLGLSLPLFAIGLFVFLVFSLFLGLKKKGFKDVNYEPFEKAEAEVEVRQLSFVQTDTGILSWALDATAAALSENGQNGLLKNVAVKIPYGNSYTLLLKGDEGAVNSAKKEFSIWKKSGLMTVEFENGYAVQTRGLQWSDARREIVSQGSAVVTGPRVKIDGNSLKISVDKQEMTIIGDVKALVH